MIGLGKIPNAIWAGNTTDQSIETQIGCGYCLAEGMTAPAEYHIAYFYQGTSMCARHFKEKVGG